MASQDSNNAKNIEVASPKRALQVEKFSTIEEVHERIRELEKESATRYVSRARKKNFGGIGPVDLAVKHLVCFYQQSDTLSIPNDGCPYFTLGTKQWLCHLGKEKKTKWYVPEGGYVRRRDSKKVDCPVIIWVKHIMKFPQFKIPLTNRRHASVTGDKYRRNLASKKVKTLLESGQDLTGQCVYEFYMTIPRAEDHKGHPISGLTAGFRHELNPRVVAVMNNAIRLGVNRVSDINNIVYSYVKKEFFPKKKPDRMDKRFFPTKLDVQKHLKRFVMSNVDKQNTENLVSKWQQNIIEDFIYFRPHFLNMEVPYIPHPKACFKNVLEIPDLDRMRRNVANDTSAPLLFCYQSVWQKRLMSLHGNQMTFLDPAHLALPCEYPIYFLVVLTNVGFVIVGVIILEKSSQELLQEALRIFRNWNPGWKPSTFMVSLDEDDASAVQAVFKEKGIRLHINEDQRENAWRSWQEDTSDGIENKAEVVKMMREIAAVPSREKLKKALEALHESEIWTGDALLRHWFTETWENRIKQWTTAYFDKTLDLMMNVSYIKDSMTALLLHKPIRPFRNDTLLEMITRLIKFYLPKSYINYTRMNVDTPVNMTKTRALPEFLRNSPAAAIVGESVTSVVTSSTWLSKGLLIVSKAEPGLITVEMKAGEREEVRLGNAEKFPSCTCAAWNANRLPCVHFFSVVRFVPSVNWENFSPLYRECLLFQTDYNCNTVVPYTPDRDTSSDVVVSDDEEMEEDDDVIESDSEADDAESDIDYGGAISDSPPNSPEVAQAVQDLLKEDSLPVTPSVPCSTTTDSENRVVAMDTGNKPVNTVGPIIESVRSLISSTSSTSSNFTPVRPASATSGTYILMPSAQAKVSPACKVNLFTITNQVQKIIKPKPAGGDKKLTRGISKVQESVSTNRLAEVITSSSVAITTTAVAEKSSVASTTTAVASSSVSGEKTAGCLKPVELPTTSTRQEVSTMANSATIVVEATIPGTLPSTTRLKRNADGTYVVNKAPKVPNKRSTRGDAVKKPVLIAPAVSTPQSAPVPLQNYMSTVGNKPIKFTPASSVSSLPILTNITIIGADSRPVASKVISGFPVLVPTTNLSTSVTPTINTATVTTVAPASSATTTSTTMIVTSSTVACPSTASQILKQNQSASKAQTKLATASTSQSPGAKIPNILTRGKVMSALPSSSQSSDINESDDGLDYKIEVDADWIPDLEIDLPEVAKQRSISTRSKSRKNAESSCSSEKSLVSEKQKYDTGTSRSSTATKTTSSSVPNQTATSSTSPVKPTLVTIMPSEPEGKITENTLSSIMDLLKKKGALKGQKVCFTTAGGVFIGSCESEKIVSEHFKGAPVSLGSSGTLGPNISFGTPVTQNPSGTQITQSSSRTPVHSQGTMPTVVILPTISASAVPVAVQNKDVTMVSLLQNRTAISVQSNVSTVTKNKQSKGIAVSSLDGSWPPVKTCVKPPTPKKVMVSASTQTMEMPAMVSASMQTMEMPAVKETKKAPKTKKQKLIRKCEETLKHVGDTLQLVKDDEYLTQLNDQLHGLLGELREIVSIGRIGPRKQVKQESVLEVIPAPPNPVSDYVPVGPSPSKRMRLGQLQEAIQSISVTDASTGYEQTFPSQSAPNETYYEVEYVEVPQSEIEPAVSCIKLEAGSSGIQQILDALNVVSQEEVVGYP